MRRNAPFAHTDTPFLGVTPGGAWVATQYEECYRIAQDWQHFSSYPTPEDAEQFAGDLLVTLDPPRQQKFRKWLSLRGCSLDRTTLTAAYIEHKGPTNTELQHSRR